MSSNGPSDEILARAARRAIRGPAPLIASLIEVWRRAFRSDAATELAVSDRVLNELALCLRPYPERWVEDVSEIAQDLDIDLDQLISFLRAAEAVERFKMAHPSNTAQAGRLLAARDHDEDE